MSHTNTESSLLDYFGEPISVYTRQQAIEDGVLVDVTKWAKEAGFTLPAVVTQAVWEDCCAWSGDAVKQRLFPQDLDGRIWDVVFMAAVEAREHQDSSQIHFVINRVPHPGCIDKNRTVTLKLHVGPGDNGEGVITIMQPHED